MTSPAAVPTVIPTSAQGTRGDANGSGTVAIVYALLIAQHYVGLIPTVFNQANADSKCSVAIDITDARNSRFGRCYLILATKK